MFSDGNPILYRTIIYDADSKKYFIHHINEDMIDVDSMFNFMVERKDINIIYDIHDY